jgi:hypothetical protein
LLGRKRVVALRFLLEVLYYWKDSSVWEVPAEGSPETRIMENHRQDHAHRLGGHWPADRQRTGSTSRPDGEWLLYNRRDHMDSDIMLVENFK